MGIAGPDEAREFSADDVRQFLAGVFGKPLDDQLNPVDWNLVGVTVSVDRERGSVIIYGLDPDQRVCDVGQDPRAANNPVRLFYSQLLGKYNDGWYVVMAEGRKKMNLVLPLAEFEGLC